jgi:predicted dehydrogenase
MTPITRRSFYLGAAAAISAARVFGANDRIRVGIVGLGGRGTDHVKLYLRASSAQIAGLCDVNRPALAAAQARLAQANAPKAAEYNDMREMFANKELDAISIAAPNHWHALATIWACEAGKDVYVEKPASHNVHESYRMIDVVRRSGRIVQVGMQSRSTPHKIKAIGLLKSGVIGDLYAAKALCFKRRKSIGHAPVEPVPPGLDWSLFLGPAQMKEYTKLRFAYNWHWFWDTGNGDIGNQGVHQMDVARWGMGELGLPAKAASTGGKYVYTDDQETPNTQLATLSYPGREIVFDVRGLLTGPEGGLPVKPGNVVGNLFYGANGWMWLDDEGFQIYTGEANEKVQDERRPGGEDGTFLHIQNFLAACRTRDAKSLHAPIEVGATSASLCHFANIGYRVGRTLTWDDAARRFTGDAQADALLTRNYRKPFVV